jgi:hypothetical protein
MSDLASLARVRGVLGCALVEGHTGMVIHHAGDLPDIVQIGEAAVEFWRLYVRLNNYFSSDFGPLEQQACFFKHRALALLPWPRIQGAVLVCVGSKAGVDWVSLNRLSRSHPS